MTPRVQAYADAAAEEFGVEAAQILSSLQSKRVSHARGHVIRQLLNDGFTVSQIGRWLKRDHSTVIYWQRKTAP